MKLSIVLSAVLGTAAAAAMSTSDCGPGLLVCQVSDPTRSKAPWAGSLASFPQCYDPMRYNCADNFLCPATAPRILGQYACGSENSVTSSTTAPLNVTVLAPCLGDVDAIMGFDFIVDIMIEAMDTSANGIIPYTPLFQDMNSSTFGPGPNDAFRGLVILQNTTAARGLLEGPTTNLAGLFQLNTVAKSTSGMNQYNSVWLAGAALFGTGPSELVVYYVKGTAEKNASFTPGTADGLISNVVRVPFIISNRSTNTLPTSTTICVNGAMSMSSSMLHGVSPDKQVSVQIFHPSSGETVGINGSKWLLDIALDATSSMSNTLLSADNGYTSAFVGPMSPSFKPGHANPYAPGLVVLLNTTMFNSSTPFRGPGTNLAALFQVNDARVVECDTIIEIWNSWFVGRAIAGHGACEATVFVVNGTAPGYVGDYSTSGLEGRADLISSVSTVGFMLS